MAEVSNTAMRRLAPVAAHQEGLVTTAQLRAAGLRDEGISRWASTGRLHPIFRTVFVLGHRAVGPRARLRAVTLTCGPGALISHRSAAWLLGLRETNPATVDVIRLGQSGRKVDGIRPHRVPYPAGSERASVAGIPCTSVARTIVDLAGTYGDKEPRETVEMAAVTRLLDVAAIDAVLVSGPRRRGTPCLRRVLDDWRPVAETAGYATVRSLFEAKLLPLVAAANLPIPCINARISTAERTLEVDLLWDLERLVVEADGRRHHGIEVAFDRDRRRDRELMAAGYAVLRVTWREVEREADAIFATVRGELERRGPRAR